MTDYDIVQANAGLIYKIMNERFYGVEREDLFQAGAVGVLKAYKNYKKNGMTKFSTYAYEYVFGEMYQMFSSPLTPNRARRQKSGHAETRVEESFVKSKP